LAETSLTPDAPSLMIDSLLSTYSHGVTATANNSGGTTGTSADWPIYTANKPDFPDNILTIFDTAGVKLGRYMKGGKTVGNPGFQIQIRSTSYPIGWQKANKIFTSLSEDVALDSVTIGSNTYTVNSIILTNPQPLSLGKEIEGKPGTSKRYLFSVNGLISYRPD
jgi:hypothetical protein